MKIALLTTDNREDARQYGKLMPFFGTAPEALLQGLAGLKEVEVHVVTCTQQPVRSPEKLAENIFFHSLHVPRLGWLRTGYQGCVRAVRRKLAEIKPDVVHGQGTERWGALSAVWSGFPNVVTIHGNMRLISRVNGAWPFSYQWLAARLEEFTLPRTDGVVCITGYTQAAVRGLARRTWLTPNAVDQTFFQLEPHPSSPPTVLCVGHISPRKNQNAFIRALDSVRTQADFTVHFFGGVEPATAYGQEFSQLLASRPWCRYEGFSGRETLKSFFQKACLLALPSIEDNCPMVVLEAMAAGVPVLAARVGGVPELVTDGVTGLLCDPLVAASMAGGVSRLLHDSNLREKIQQAAKACALEKFHPRIIARRHLDIYAEVLKTRA